MSREEASKVLIDLLQKDLDPDVRLAIDIALDSIAAVDRLTKVLDSYIGEKND